MKSSTVFRMFSAAFISTFVVSAAAQPPRHPGVIGLKSEEEQDVLDAVDNALELNKVGETARYYVPNEKKAPPPEGFKRIGRNVSPGDTMFFDENDKLKYAQNADGSIRDASGNRLIYDDMGNLLCIITPKGEAFCRSTSWDRAKKADFLADAGETGKAGRRTNKQVETQPIDLHGLDLDDPNGDWCKCENPGCEADMDVRLGRVSFGCSKCGKVNVKYAKMALELERKIKAAGGTPTWFGTDAEQNARRAAEGR